MHKFLTSSIVRVFNSVVMASIVLGLAVFTVLIGVYNYDRAMTDLRKKASNAAELASISLAEPLWNFDKAAMEGILTAILLDDDAIGIRVAKPGKADGGLLKLRESHAQSSFDDLLKDPANIETSAPIMREGEEVAKVQIVTSTDKVKGLIRYTTLLISAFAVIFVLVLSAFIWYLGKRIVQRPIDALRGSAEQLASGRLDYPIDTSRHDELGSLAHAFEAMRDSIRKKLDDLAILNKTGETMAGIHDQTEALRTAIRVMSEQTRVERGSIYLLGEDDTLHLHACYPELPDGASFPKQFKLSEGIAGQVASTAKLMFIPDVSKAAGYVARPGEESRALLCVPMMDDKTVFGVMNFVGEVGKVSFAAEEEGFAMTIARMTVITTKNIQMLKVIEEHNRTLEERILERTAQLRQKTNDVNAMLQNMRQGIFTIIAGGHIHAEYSAFLGEIFQTNDIAGREVAPFLFSDSDVGSDALNQVVATIDSIIGEEAMNFEFNSHLLLTEFSKHFTGQSDKILELDWNPVVGADDLVEKLMVTVRDVTELKALQLETEKQKTELEIIGQILAISKDKLLEFISTSYEFMDENRALIERTQERDLDILATLFRNMHTIKGNARTYGLSHVTDRVHEAETVYSTLRTDATYPWNQEELLAQLQVARDCIVRYETTYREKLAGFADGGVDNNFLEHISRAVEGINEMSQLKDLKLSIQQVRNSIDALRYETPQEVLKGIIAAMPSIARQLGKETPEIEVTDNAVRVQKEIVPMLRNVFMHVFRNTMDHGLEATEQRLGAGKPAQGRIRLDVRLDEDQVLFSFSDDGKGLALAHIHNKAISNGQVAADAQIADEEIAEFIFLSGLSTATEVTNVSGRGVGMDAIRKFLQKNFGDVRIEFTDARTDNGYRPFRLLINLPARLATRFATGDEESDAGA